MVAQLTRRGKPRKNSFWIGMFIPWSQVSEHWGIVQTYPWFYQQSRGNCLDSAAWLSKHSGFMASHGTTSFHLQELLIDLGMETVMRSQVPQKVPKHMDGSWRASMRQLTQLTMYITSYTDISWYIDIYIYIYRVYPNQWTLCGVPFHTLVGPHPKNCRKVVGKAYGRQVGSHPGAEWGALGKLWQTLHKAVPLAAPWWACSCLKGWSWDLRPLRSIQQVFKSCQTCLSQSFKAILASRLELLLSWPQWQ